MQCKPVAGWEAGDHAVLAGGIMNTAAAPWVRQVADGHLATWNASAALWDVHMPGECTHYCSPTAYHLWLYLAVRELAAGGLGNALAPPRPVQATAARQQAA